MSTPEIYVGIMSEKVIAFELKGNYSDQNGADISSGKWTATQEEGKIILTNKGQSLTFGNSIVLYPSTSKESIFELYDVTIGIDFHWERKENQIFKGGLKLLIEEDKITAINFLSVEDYLISVISSEMSATSSMELLKAHAVISRSWLLAQIEKNQNLKSEQSEYISFIETDNERMRWYDREDHENFDVCADDHCQRYQGITRASTALVEQAVTKTYGQVVSFEGNICDARYSKCCGGIAEVFENVWEPVNHPYLQNIVDNDVIPEDYSLELTNEQASVDWIKGNPSAFCNTTDKKVLSQVLNDYDQETFDFFRWQVIYTQNEISELIHHRTGIDFGEIVDLAPIERGTSGRLIKLKITGAKRTMTIGKELEIRKALSSSHLYSSAFVIEKEMTGGELKFILRGAGWGHGVGLCQIGAAVMGEKGYSYEEILKHYFRGAELEKRY